MLRKVILYGELADKYGAEHTFDVHGVGDTILALRANYPDFYKTIRDGSWHFLCGEDLNNCISIGEEEIGLVFGRGDFHILPAVQGKKSGWWKVLIGVILIAASVVTFGATLEPGAALTVGGLMSSGYGVVAGVGLSLALAGVTQMLAPIPKLEAPNEEVMAESPIYKGPLNRIEQGHCVPLVYGRMLVGSRVVSASAKAEEIYKYD